MKLNLMLKTKEAMIGVTEDFYPQARLEFFYNPEAVMDARALKRLDEVKDQFRAELERVMEEWN